jgi:hypothetical protein
VFAAHQRPPRQVRPSMLPQHVRLVMSVLILFSFIIHRAMHQHWHHACFVCTACQQPFEGDYCTISNAPYCKQVRRAPSALARSAH